MKFFEHEAGEGRERSPERAPLRVPRMAEGRPSLIMANGMPKGGTLLTLIGAVRERKQGEDR